MLEPPASDGTQCEQWRRAKTGALLATALTALDGGDFPLEAVCRRIDTLFDCGEVAACALPRGRGALLVAAGASHGTNLPLEISEFVRWKCSLQSAVLAIV